MTLMRQWKEYYAKHPNGYRRTGFLKHVNRYLEHHTGYMVVPHKYGDQLFVDDAGRTLPYADTETGELIECQIFVAILPASQYVYVEAQPSQKQEYFIEGIRNAMRYMGGVPQDIVPDNLKRPTAMSPPASCTVTCVEATTTPISTKPPTLLLIPKLLNPMNNLEQNSETLRKLRLYGMARAYTTLLETPNDTLSAHDLLRDLVDTEWSERRGRAIDRLIRGAKFRYTASISELYYFDERGIELDLVQQLASGVYLQKVQNI